MGVGGRSNTTQLIFIDKEKRFPVAIYEFHSWQCSIILSSSSLDTWFISVPGTSMERQGCLSVISPYNTKVFFLVTICIPTAVRSIEVGTTTHCEWKILIFTYFTEQGQLEQNVVYKISYFLYIIYYVSILFGKWHELLNNSGKWII